jgi:hypothetical protein
MPKNEKKMKHATKGILLSGLVYPGLGQLALGRRTTGIVIIALASTGLGVFIHGLVLRFIAVFNYIRDIINDHIVSPGHISDLYLRALLPASWLEIAGICLLVGCWLYSLIHAFDVGRKLDSSRQTESF